MEHHWCQSALQTTQLHNLWYDYVLSYFVSIDHSNYSLHIILGIVAFSSAQYGQGSGPILIDDIACTGTETSLQSCTYDSNTEDCSHAEDAGVRCHSCELYI